MNWGRISIERLKDYNARCVATETIPEQIKTLELQYRSIRSATTEETPVRGGASTREDVLLNNIAKREELKRNLEIAEREIGITNRGLSVLNVQERRVLTMFYIDRPKGYMEALCDEMAYEKSKIYQIKDEALRKFTMAAYGVVQI